MLITRDLSGFIESRECDTHVVIEGRSLVMRCRKEIRPIAGYLSRMVVLSTIEVEPAQRGRGHFSAFLEEAEPIADRFDMLLVVEQVINARLAWFLERREYTPMVDFSSGLSYARLIDPPTFVVDAATCFGAVRPASEVEVLPVPGTQVAARPEAAGLVSEPVPSRDERPARAS
ncbi:MAG: hypothetical protein AAGI30_09330 [Planctomycetota bacterium]